MIDWLPALKDGDHGFVIVLTLVYIVYSLRGESGGAGSAVAKAFFSDDDGQTYFTDAADKIPPFDHKGKQAVTAYVFRCNGGKPFVGYLEMYDPQTKKVMEDALSGKAPPVAYAGYTGQDGGHASGAGPGSRAQAQQRRAPQG